MDAIRKCFESSCEDDRIWIRRLTLLRIQDDPKRWGRINKEGLSSLSALVKLTAKALVENFNESRPSS
jgi:hypothetical protein